MYDYNRTPDGTVLMATFWGRRRTCRGAGDRQGAHASRNRQTPEKLNDKRHVWKEKLLATSESVVA